MSITFEKTKQIFTIQTDHTTYQLQADRYGYLIHLYYGPRVEGEMDYLLTFSDHGFSGNPYDAGSDRTYSLDALPQEYPVQGNGDFRSVCLTVRGESGSASCDLRYKGYEISSGKYGIPGLPAVYAGDEECETLDIYLRDEVTGLAVTLRYGVLPRLDVITRSGIIRNEGENTVTLDRAQTVCLDFSYGNYDLIRFYGRHAMERNVQRSAIGHGATVIGSRRGTSSHQYNPFVIAAETGTTEDHGVCYGLSFVYSGNFKCEAEQDQYGQTRITMGLQDELFSYHLNPGSSFHVPEVILSCTGQGLARLSHQFHRLYRRNLCRGKYRDIPRPVLINNWEATYFDFNGEKIEEIARQAKELGVEMLVLDDGWYGNRNSDTCGLGDWYVNEKKLGQSLNSLVSRVNAMGLKFGIWIEPEMISEDSDLYREHPDWAFAVPGRKPVRSRDQLVLDFSRKEVVDGIFDQICRVLDGANIEYVKWDMNRSITDVYSAAAEANRQGEVLYDYMLGLYDFLERLVKRYPDLLLEGCSGGGGRFDAGMLYYSPQIWCSDNTDAMDRIQIQYGTSFGYPVSCVGAHVSAVPNHQTGRVTPMKTRGVVAMSGSFGYELDLNRITEEEKACVREQIQTFHRYWSVIHEGDYYRLTDPGDGVNPAAWEQVKQDGSEALLSVVTQGSHGNPTAFRVCLKGLKENAVYQDSDTGRFYHGSALMNGGIPVPQMSGDYQAWQLHLTEKADLSGMAEV